jgi:hypothetical protein
MINEFIDNINAWLNSSFNNDKNSEISKYFDASAEVWKNRLVYK